MRSTASASAQAESPGTLWTKPRRIQASGRMTDLGRGSHTLNIRLNTTLQRVTRANRLYRQVSRYRSIAIYRLQIDGHPRQIHRMA